MERYPIQTSPEMSSSTSFYFEIKFSAPATKINTAFNFNWKT